MVTERGLWESPDLIPLVFCLWGWMKHRVYKIKVDTCVTYILDAAAHMKKCEDQLEQHMILHSSFKVQ